METIKHLFPNMSGAFQNISSKIIVINFRIDWLNRSNWTFGTCFLSKNIDFGEKLTESDPFLEAEESSFFVACPVSPHFDARFLANEKRSRESGS